MPRGPAPQWKRRAEPVLDDHVRASVDAANGKHDPETGHYATLRYVDCATKERADEIKRALYRCAKYLGYSMSAQIKKASDDTWLVEYKAIDKVMARKHVLEKYGTDRSKWPYDPRARNKENQ